MDLEKKIVICMDRDGTLTKDENYYLGSNPNWKQQVEFMQGVIEGLRLSMTIPNSYRFILTNQSGVALEGEQFARLTEKRMHEVNKYIISELKKQGIDIHSYFACPFVDHAYVKKSTKKGRIISPRYLHNNHPDLKPNPGMINQTLKHLNLKRKDCLLFMIGDRYSDMELAKNANAMGILVESYKTKELGDSEKTKSMGFYVARNFLDAIIKIKEQVEQFT